MNDTYNLEQIRGACTQLANMAANFQPGYSTFSYDQSITNILHTCSKNILSLKNMGYDTAQVEAEMVSKLYDSLGTMMTVHLSDYANVNSSSVEHFDYCLRILLTYNMSKTVHSRITNCRRNLSIYNKDKMRIWWRMNFTPGYMITGFIILLFVKFGLLN